MTAVTVTAVLDSPVVEPTRHPIYLDSILAFARALDGDLDPLVEGVEPVVPLPLHRWDEAGTWGWKASAGVFTVAGWGTAEVRRKPATDAMARYGAFHSHHSGLGPHKARDLRVEIGWVHEIVWHADTTHPGQLEALLRRVHGIGKHAGIGYGHVREWRVEPGLVEGWRHRPLPTRGGRPERVRPPYWWPTGRVPVGGP